MGEPQLHNIQFLYHEWQQTETPSKSLLELIKDEQTIADTARNLGAHIIHVLQATGPEIEPRTDRPTYRLNIDYNNYHDRLAELLKTHSESLPLLPTQTLPELSSTESIDPLFENGQSFVLAYTRYTRGHGKYLIEHKET